MVFLQQTDDYIQDNTSHNCGGSIGVTLVVHVVTRQSLCGHRGEVRQKNLTLSLTHRTPACKVPPFAGAIKMADLHSLNLFNSTLIFDICLTMHHWNK
jgi:hypothetical protein